MDGFWEKCEKIVREGQKSEKNSSKKLREIFHELEGSNVSLLWQKTDKKTKRYVGCIAVCLIKNEIGESKMTREEKVAELERMLVKVPDVMSPLRASKCSPFGKNRIYELLKSKEFRAFVFQGSYIIAKTDLIETLVDHSDRQGRTYKIGHEVK